MGGLTSPAPRPVCRGRCPRVAPARRDRRPAGARSGGGGRRRGGGCALRAAAQRGLDEAQGLQGAAAHPAAGDVLGDPCPRGAGELPVRVRPHRSPQPQVEQPFTALGPYAGSPPAKQRLHMPETRSPCHAFRPFHPVGPVPVWRASRSGRRPGGAEPRSRPEPRLPAGRGSPLARRPRLPRAAVSAGVRCTGSASAALRHAPRRGRAAVRKPRREGVAGLSPRRAAAATPRNAAAVAARPGRAPGAGSGPL